MGCCILKRSFHVRQNLNLCTADRLLKKTRSWNEIDLILFKKRHPLLPIRIPDGIPAAFYVRKRGRAFWLSYTITKSIIPQDRRIFFDDETGITAVQHTKCVNTRGKQEVASLTSAGRRNLIALIACMNVISAYVPPLNTLDHCP